MKFSYVFNRLLVSGLVLSSFVSLNSCKNEIAVNDNAPVTPTAVFNYENKSDMKLDLTFRDSYGKPNGSGVLVKIYTENPYDGLTFKSDMVPNITCRADRDGRFSTTVPVPGHLNCFYVVVDNQLYQRLMIIKKSSSYTSNVYPAGFGVLQKTPSARGAVAAPISYTRNVSYGLPVSANNYVLSAYNATSGKPNVLETSEPAAADLLTRISTALPEGTSRYNQRLSNHFFDNVDQANIQVVDNANVWVTFLSEGAGVNNTMGYYYYPTNNPPANAAAISKKLIVFPNASTNANDGSGTNGDLTNGTKVKLKYQDPNTGEWSDVFPGGTTISWWIRESGWGGSSYDYLFSSLQLDQYSMPSFNAGSYPQTVLLYDGSTQKIILGFEDTSLSPRGRGNSAGTYSSDEDYNDVVFAISANPITAINTDPIPRLPNSGDRDGDGEPDGTDDYPDDPLRAHNNYYPGASTFGTLSFEDNWPLKGDYDMNDLVLDYRILYITNHAGQVKDVEIQTRTKAIGATYQNGLAWELTADQANVASISTSYAGPGTLLPGNVFPLDPKGFESNITPTSSKVVVPLYDNAFTLFGSSYIDGYVNTVEGSTYYNPVNLYKRVTFTNPVSVASLGSLPYNPFLVVNGVRAREVHKTGKTPTSKAALGYFNTYDDLSSTLGYYTGTSNYPWVLDLPVSAEYSTESQIISNGFSKFNTWVSTAGAQYSDWYSNKTAGYRGSSIYSRH